MKTIMKGFKLTLKSTFLLAAIALYFSSCSKKDNPTPTPAPTGYASVTFANVKSRDTLMTANAIAGTSSSGVLLKKGDVLSYITKTGLYGKLQIDSIDITNNFALTIDATTYKADGTVSKQIQGLVIEGTWSCDLDNLIETSDGDAADFFWERETDTDTQIGPSNDAKFAKYTFKN